MHKKKLLLCSVRRVMDDKAIARAKRIASGDIGWDYILRNAIKHSVASLLYHNLKCNEIRL